MVNSVPAPTSWIEVDARAYRHNIDFIRTMIGPDVRFCSVVKGNAYGHGIDTMVRLGDHAGVSEYGVYSADEAYEVHRCSDRPKRIMIMGNLWDDELEWAIENDVSFFVFSKQRLDQAQSLAAKIGKAARVHLEIETGMNRTGIGIHELDHFIGIITSHPEQLRWAGLCTHFAGAESIANYLRVKKQFVLFRKILKHVKKTWPQMPESIHTACSAAALRYPSTHYDLVRIGILQYGFFPSREVQVEYMATQDESHVYPLRRIVSWKSRVMDIKSVHTGEFIGYGTSYLSNSPMRIASIPVGYAHGFSRSLSNQGRVLIGGQQAKVVGMVNMNMIQADVTGIPEVHAGTEVVLIGRQGDQEISVSSFAEYSDQVNYELLTRLPHNIPRIIKNL